MLGHLECPSTLEAAGFAAAGAGEPLEVVFDEMVGGSDLESIFADRKTIDGELPGDAHI